MKMINRILPLFLSASMVLSSCFLTVAGKDYSGHWAEGSIGILIEKGVISGDASGNINPDHTITRGEFAKIVNRYFQYTKKAASSFLDVSQDAWYHDEFLIAKEAGYITGDSQGKANPEGRLSRAEVSVILARILKLGTADTQNSFTDQDAIASWAKGSVVALSKAGYLKGYTDGTFRPEQFLTRGEAFYLLNQLPKDKPEELKADSDMGNTGGMILSGQPSRGGSSGGGGGGSTAPKVLSEPVPRTIKQEQKKESILWDSVSKAKSYDVKVSIENVDPVYIKGVKGTSADITNAVAQVCESAFDPTVTVSVAVKANASSGYQDSQYSMPLTFLKKVYDDSQIVDVGLKLNFELSPENKELYSVSFDGVAKKLTLRNRTDTYQLNNVSGYLNLEPYLAKAGGEIQADSYTLTVFTEDGLQVLYFNTAFAGGSGLAEDPYVIGTLRHFMQAATYPAAHFIQIADIDTGMNLATFYERAGNVPFSGSYVGKGETPEDRVEIKVQLTDAKSNASVFGVIDSATIKNIKVSGTITASEDTKKDASYLNVGGIAGSSLKNSIIDNCENTANIFGGTNTGGILGLAGDGDLIRNCENNGDIETNFVKIGGILGYQAKSTAKVEGCLNSGSIHSNLSISAALTINTPNTYHAAGGIVGHGVGPILNSENKENAVITGEQAVGGIVGYYQSPDLSTGIENCTNSGTVIYDPLSTKAFNVYIGGIAGYIRGGKILGSTSTETSLVKANDVKTSGTLALGGISGYIFTAQNIDLCANYGAVIGSTAAVNNVYIGGIVGHSFGNVTNSVNHSHTLNSRQIGGIVGRHDGGIVEYCYNTGNLPATAGNKGGIVAYAAAPISYCYNTGSATSLHSGGIVGTQTGIALTSCYTVISENSTNAAAYNLSKIILNDVYYIIDNEATVTTVSGQKIERSNFTQATKGFENEEIWVFPETGLPYLKSNPL